MTKSFQNKTLEPSLRAKRGNPSKVYTLGWIASHSFAMTQETMTGEVIK